MEEKYFAQHRCRYRALYGIGANLDISCPAGGPFAGACRHEKHGDFGGWEIWEV